MEPNNPQQPGFENQPMHQHFGPQNQFGLTPPEKLPNAVGVLVLGILSLLCCGLIGLILAIIALVMGSNAINLYQASPGRYTKESYNMAVAGRICAIIGLLLSILSAGYGIMSVINGNNPYDFLN
jgi:uncharacterized membrane protein